MIRFLRFLFKNTRSRDYHFSKYLPECCTTPFTEYTNAVDPIHNGTNDQSFFNHISFGSSIQFMRKKMGKPDFIRTQEEASIDSYKRKVGGLKFVIKLYYIENELVHFESECREQNENIRQSLVNTILEKHQGVLNNFSFPGNYGVKVSNVFYVKVGFYSTNRSHIDAMRHFGNENLVESSLNNIFPVSNVQFNQYI